MSRFADDPRLAELLEKQRYEALDAAEQGELRALLARDPDARALAEELDREEHTMHTTIQAAVDHFDFDKARRAVSEKLALYQKYQRMQLVIGLIAFAFVLMPSSQNFMGCFMVFALVVPILIWTGLIARRRAWLRAVANRGDEALREVYAKHLHEGRNEHTVLRATIIIVGFGMVVLLIDSLVAGDYLRAAIAGFALCFFGPIVWKRWLTKRANDRHERFLRGDLTATGWMQGLDRDEDAPA